MKAIRKPVFLGKQKIDEICDNSPSSISAIVGLYKYVLPELFNPNMESYTGYPTVSHKTWKYICDKMIKLDEPIRDKVVQGGSWMDKGFGCNRQVKDWNVDLSEIDIKYKKMSLCDG